MSIPAFVARLRLIGGIPAQGATDLEIAAALTRLSCPLSPDLRAFYKYANGLSEVTNDGVWDFYPLRRLARSLYSEPLLLPTGEKISRSSLIRFCDAGIEAISYAFCGDCELPYFGHIFADEPRESWRVASSFDEFIEVFLTSENNMLLNLSRPPARAPRQ
jgi:hypothetical protein